MSASISLKDRISAPLEAHGSVADGHQLPGRMATALEYASTRLSRKTAHITLLIVQRDFQLPALPPQSPYSVSSSLASPVTTSTRSTISSLKQLIRSTNTPEVPIRERIVHIDFDNLRNGTISPAFSDVSAGSASTAFTTGSADSIFSSHPASWPASPSCPSLPMTPATPFTVVSSSTDTGSAVSSPGLQKDAIEFGMRMVYVGPVSPRDERALNQTLEKTARKFRMGTGWLSNATSPEAIGLPPVVAQKSLEQNEALFTSKSLTVLSLDHLYTFRTSLQSYARTQSPCRLEDAVDGLRRLILANGRRKLLKSTLLTSYRWLDPVSETALADVCRMYQRAYGGAEGENGVVNDVDPVPAWPLPNFEVLPPPPPPPEATESRKPRPSWIERREDASKTPPPQLPSLDTTPKQSRISHNRWAAVEEKEVFGGLMSLELDDEDLEIDAIEAWYRDVQLPHVEIHVEPTPPVTEVEVLEEALQVTPKLAASPPRRNMALRLQTTFEKPKAIALAPASKITQANPGILRPQPSKPLSLQQEQQQIIPLASNTAEDDDEDLTARPVSAIISQPAAGWSSMSIDSMILNTPNTATEGSSSRNTFGIHGLISPISPTSPQQQRLGPLTPNGYDDISPITRNEWGFVTRALPKTAAVGCVE
ncbi:hypothetical protein QBC34DRAFT_10663 [Podospora aff. communis PSN243]|uniref:DUF7582 domain-containing protein n=1 Tax=Podospora aff. communis PSN243 TaxID=3040156 RepID=A0AAV9H6G6_9PEZI|nr:hypothetical protein QBC34DRAFT_10663 [Podospora aff. communis PSN243]